MITALDSTTRLDDDDRCAFCHRTLSATSGGKLCPVCLLVAGLGSPEQSRRIGEYELLQELTPGGMGKVFVAKHVDDERLVAIKLPRLEILQSPEGALAFRRERTAGSLRHPNIVRIERTGTEDGQPYIVMQLLEGGTLADREHRAAYRAPERALELMIRVARAVQFAHARLILHCDLKPANILLDEHGEPFVSDFGLARFLDQPGATHGGGTPGWMSPEQTAREPLTTASDVFSLGILLHWLLNGTLPFGDGADFSKRVQTEDLPMPAYGRGLRGLRWELAVIAWKAMQRPLDQRYRSPGALADDLERVRDGKPIWAERPLGMRRAQKWVRRHVLATAIGAQLFLLLLYVLLVPISVLREIKSTIREQNAFSAVAQAGAVMNELRVFADRVEALANDPRTLAILNAGDSPALESAELNGGFDALSLATAHGTVRAAWPHAPTRTGHDRSYRDYFRGQHQLGLAGQRGVYVSRAFRSSVDSDLMIGFSSPLFDANGRYAGAVIAMTKARSTFGTVQMHCTAGGDCLTALLGLRDRDAADAPPPTALRLLAAPGIARGEEKVVDTALSRRICARFRCEPRTDHPLVLAANTQPLIIDDYEDPVTRTQSIAALAPVGGTGLVALVATPNSAAEALRRRIEQRGKAFLWIPFALGLFTLLVMLTGARRSRRGR